MYDTILGFDESFQGGCDDIDFFWRAQLVGLELIFADEATVDYYFWSEIRDPLRLIRTQASQEPLLYLKRRRNGMPRPFVNYAIRRWATFAAVLPSIAISARQRRRWGVRIFYPAGGAMGALRYRVMYL